MDKQIKSVIVIGGGLGGLLFAQLMRDSGINVTVYERDQGGQSRFQGYVIGINADGLRCLKAVEHRLPSLTALLQANNQPATFAMTDKEFNVLITVGGKKAESSLVNRRSLRDVLAEGIHIEWGKKFVRYEEQAGSVVAHFEDGSTATGDILLGADGLSSHVRKQRTTQIINKEVPITNIGAVFTVPEHPEKMFPRMFPLAQQYALRTFGVEGHSFLVMKYIDVDGKEKICWALTHSGAMKDSYPVDDPAAIKQVMIGRARKYVNDELAQLVELTDPETYITHVNYKTSHALSSRPLGATTRVTLLGDSAHAMTSHRGLGANTAFQDATDLANALKQTDWLQALKNYEATMIKRGFAAVSASYQSTEMMTLTSSTKAWVRNTMLWVVGRFI